MPFVFWWEWWLGSHMANDVNIYEHTTLLVCVTEWRRTTKYCRRRPAWRLITCMLYAYVCTVYVWACTTHRAYCNSSKYSSLWAEIVRWKEGGNDCQSSEYEAERQLWWMNPTNIYHFGEFNNIWNSDGYTSHLVVSQRALLQNNTLCDIICNLILWGFRQTWIYSGNIFPVAPTFLASYVWMLCNPTSALCLHLCRNTGNYVWPWYEWYSNVLFALWVILIIWALISLMRFFSGSRIVD